MEPDELTRKQLQLIHPEKLYQYLPNVNDQTLGALFGLSEADYRATKAHFSNQIQEVLKELLADPSMSAQAYRLPFQDNDVVLALGESHTDDALSWFNILQTLVEQISPEKHIRFLNMAVSGHTTTAALRQFTSHLLYKPTWIFCMLGVNDSLRIGINPGKTLVSRSETQRNLVYMRQLAAQANVGHWVWLTPTPIIEAAQSNNHWFRQMQLS
ncbi:SGNH/GDSL hydrolase family protein [Spirosoma sp.]|uniref:SGNH/GDSL hydrolase family protein n=1 Tax=Spirosoma sp. TaxID=1899569 RepID=UPI003B3A911F